MSAPAFDDVDASEDADGPKGGDVSPRSGPAVPAYSIDGYSVDGYRLERRPSPAPPRPAPARRARDRRPRPEPRAQQVGDQPNRRARWVGNRRQPTIPPQPTVVQPTLAPPDDADQADQRDVAAAYAPDYPAQAPRPVPRRRPLLRRRKAVPLRPHERPYARLGLLWVLLLLVAVVLGPAGLSILAAPVGLIAAASALRAARTDADVEGGGDRGPGLLHEEPGVTSSGEEPSTMLAGEGPKPDTTKPLHGAPPPDPRRLRRPELVIFGRPVVASDVRTAILGAVVVAPFVALAGPVVALAGGVVVVAAAALGGRSMGCSPPAAALAVAAPVSAMCALVVAREQGFAVGLVLVVAVCLYDAAACLMGNRPTGGFLGVVSGLLTLGVLAFLVSALANPPFGGSRAWAMCLMVGVLAWVGIKACRRLMRGGVTLPALARLDSLVVAGPVWVVVVAGVLHR